MIHSKSMSVALLVSLTVACGGAGGDDDQAQVDAGSQGSPDASIPGTPDADVPGTPDAEITPPPTLKPYGTACSTGPECAGEICLDGFCSQPCDIDDINSCIDVDAFCTLMVAGLAGCWGGPLGLGTDTDQNHIMVLGNPYTEFLTDDDADLYYVDIPIGRWQFWAEPTGTDLDVSIDVYDDIGDYLATYNSGGPGDGEGAIIDFDVPAGHFFVVGNNGVLAGQYTFEVDDCSACAL